MRIITVKTFWKGTIMSQLTMNEEEFKLLQKELQKEWFEGATLMSILEIKNELDNLELGYQKEFEVNKEYNIENMKLNMFNINGMLQKGIITNNNNYGFLITSTYE